ncbi:MarR family transcriptional regulator [Paracoccus sp. S-4012]|uniref:MarR family winged helix-turn-helix transcriptional regulator n=1 Tax=Paracoccus sp. S-4012 TaxID=2665648 RepID=UPI0012AF40DE|nr:MarR family winged helix-turn-helix transcriptional regulator [Paracoccus sp. S-4012]MRX51302.1 MarR family transcriptional regulator [Paracoccus sp. S-4012]
MSSKSNQPLLSTSESFGHNLRMSNQLIQRDLSAQLARMGLGIGQWFALRALWEGDGLTQTELAQKSGIAGPAMVATVRNLLNAGLVTRHRPKGDRRKYVIVLTDRGRALERPALESALEANAVALSGVDPQDVAACLRVLRAAQQNLQAAAEGIQLAPEAEEMIALAGR